MARRINIIHAPFDYRWPGQVAITAFTQKGEFTVKDEVAEYAISKGYAIEVKTSPPKRATTRRAKAADNRRTGRVDQLDLPGNGGAAHRRTVAIDAG